MLKSMGQENNHSNTIGTTGYHQPVMLQECLHWLALEQRREGVFVDATLGGGGHSRAILQQLGEGGRLLSFDQDGEAIVHFNAARADSRITLINENFRYMKRFLRFEGVRQVDGILADLGVSSHQIDAGERGFSTRWDGPLDMRMDSRGLRTAAALVNEAAPEELEQIMRLYGELRNAKAVARAIVAARAEAPISTTGELRKAVEPLLPRGRENKMLAVIFQALRIEVNGELDALKEMLQQAGELLKPGGRLVVMSYHSLEDRLVKNYMRAGNFEGVVKQDFFGNVLAPLRPVMRSAVVASETELAENNRARSAKLRVAEKI